MITAFLAGGETEPASGEGMAGSGAAEVNDGGELLLLVPADRGPRPGPEGSGDLTIEQGGCEFNGMARDDASVEAVEPAGMDIIPGAVFDHHMVVDTVAFRLPKCAIGQLEHPDRA